VWTWFAIDDGTRLALAAGLVVAGGLWDAGVPRRTVPSVRRQVNEDWMQRYRGWVYGVAYGAQLGVGIATIVTTAAVYTTFAVCILAGDAALGAAIGATFGVVRAIPLLVVRRVQTPQQLQAFAVRLERSGRSMMTISTAWQLALPLIVAAACLRWGG
jgi:hypothetical protein